MSAGVASVVAANCYVSGAHTIASLTCHAFGVPAEAVHLILTALENMKYYPRTAYGDSKNFRGYTIAVKFQGLCQGNGANPAGWAVINIVVLGAHKKKRVMRDILFVQSLFKQVTCQQSLLWTTTTSSMLTWERTSQHTRLCMTCNATLVTGAVF